MSILLKWHSPGNGGENNDSSLGGNNNEHQSRGARVNVLELNEPVGLQSITWQCQGMGGGEHL